MRSSLNLAISIYKSSQWLGTDLVAMASDALTANEEGSFSLAVIKAGACLEGILKRVLTKWGTQSDGQPTLGPLIGLVRDSRRAPKELLERLNEANTIRNRAPHNKAHPKLSQVTAGDSLQIINILALTVDWFEEEFPTLAESGDDSTWLPVFLSVGGPHRLSQQQFLQNLMEQMRTLRVELRTLTSGEYAQEKPFDQIRDIISKCRAALVVGLDRSHAYTIFERERSDREKLYQDQYIPTAWNQIEASIASALRRPILILRESRLHREGIFEAENHDHRICDFDLDTESKNLSANLRDLLAGWVKFVRTEPAK